MYINKHSQLAMHVKQPFLARMNPDAVGPVRVSQNQSQTIQYSSLWVTSHYILSSTVGSPHSKSKNGCFREILGFGERTGKGIELKDRIFWGWDFRYPFG